MKEIIVIQLLNSFFLLFKARVDEYKIQNNKIFGTVAWENEEDKQDFSLSLENWNNFSDIRLLCNYLNENNLVNGDRIIISEKELINKLIGSGWNKDDAERSINYLCSFDVKMVDDEEETDSFFIHF